jgi:hypothetical protein
MREKLFTLTLFSLLFLLTTLTAAAQTNDRPPETSFEITLSVVSGSNDTGSRGELPQSLAPVAKQLRSTFGLTNLRLADTYVGRIGNNGTISYKSLANIDNNAQPDTPSFLDWTIGGLRNAAGSNAFYIQAFRFGARVPIRVSSGNDATGKALSTINYEAIGLNVERVTLAQSTPVLIGTIAMPKADGGRVFLVLNVSPASN